MDDLVLLSGQISKHIENTTKYHHIKNNTKYHHIGNTTTYHHHFFPPRIVVFNKILDPLCTNNVDYMVATVNGGSIFGWANRHKVWRLKDWWMVVREEFSSKITYWKIVNVYPYCTLLVRRWKEPKIFKSLWIIRSCWHTTDSENMTLGCIHMFLFSAMCNVGRVWTPWRALAGTCRKKEIFF